jgi:hypothetical protein
MSYIRFAGGNARHSPLGTGTETAPSPSPSDAIRHGKTCLPSAGMSSAVGAFSAGEERRARFVT